MRIGKTPWVPPSALLILAKHGIETMEQLAALELGDSMADVIPIDGLRAMAKRARRTLGWDDPLAMIGASAGQRGDTVYAGGVRYSDGKE